jgi:hypothetical protein
MRRLLVVLFLAALVSPARASDKFTVHDDRPLDDARRPAHGKALIYFVRTQTMGFAVKVKLYADGKFAGLIMSKTYIPLEVAPGKHEFIVEAENAGFLEAEVAPDRIYVVQVAIHMGAMKARTHFEVARAGSEAMEEFLRARKSLRALSTTDEGIGWVQEEEPKIQNVIKKYREKGQEVERLKSEDGSVTPPWMNETAASSSVVPGQSR